MATALLKHIIKILTVNIHMHMHSENMQIVV